MTEKDFSLMRKEILELGNLTNAPAMYDAEGYSPDGGARAIFFDSMGLPDPDFCVAGIAGKSLRQSSGSGIGSRAGGTAFKEWVKKWNDHGYAAISIADEGQIDVLDLSGGKPVPGHEIWNRHNWPGPKRVDIYGDSEEPLTSQWMDHAVADTILANSLLRSLLEVDSDKIGVMGISWGGIVVSTVIGIDRRFAFAIPTYGCGHLFDAGNRYGTVLGNNPMYREVWDPMVRMSRVNFPVLWLSWPEDPFFPLNDQAATYRTAPGPRMVSLIPGMNHGHKAAWNPPCSYAFADSIVRQGKPWCQQVEVQIDHQKVSILFRSTKPLDSAKLIYTTDTGFTGKR